MSMVYGIFTIIAGIIYLLWQYHKENPGALTMFSVMFLVGFGPFYFWSRFVQDGQGAERIVGAIGIIVHFILFVGFLIYSEVKKDDWAREDAKERKEIWDEVYKLPIPDSETLKTYKIAYQIPLRPEDCKTYNDAAISRWRNAEFEKRYAEKHLFVAHFSPRR